MSNLWVVILMTKGIFPVSFPSATWLGSRTPGRKPHVEEGCSSKVDGTWFPTPWSSQSALNCACSDFHMRKKETLILFKSLLFMVFVKAVKLYFCLVFFVFCSLLILYPLGQHDHGSSILLKLFLLFNTPGTPCSLSLPPHFPLTPKPTVFECHSPPLHWNRFGESDLSPSHWQIW